MNKLLGILVCLGLLCSSYAKADDADKSKVLWRQGSLSATRISGTWREIGYHAAELSNVNLSTAAPTAINNYFNHALSGLSSFAPVVWLAGIYLDMKYFNPLISHILPEDVALMDGIAAKTGIPAHSLRKAFAIPDSINAILLTLLKPARKLASLQMCSSFAAFGPRTVTGERIFGRNLDYPAVGSIDVASTVYLLKPQGGYQILTVAPEGFPAAGISGMNEKGLIAIMQDAFSNSVSFSGTPMMSVNREVLEHASTIEEALAIYNKYQYESAWMVHLSDRDPNTNIPRSAIVEFSGLGVTYHFDKDSHTVLSNSYQTTEQKSHELFISAGVAFYNRDRLNRLDELVMAKPLTVDDAIDILRDSYSPTAKTQMEYSHSGIRNVDQVNSMVFLPDQGKVLVAAGLAPASYGAFYEFSFDQMNRGLPPVKVKDAKPKPPSFDELTAAYVANAQGDHYGYYRHLMLADSLAHDCSYKLVAGAAALGYRDYSSASDLLNGVVACSAYNIHQKAIANLLLGYLNWNYGDRDLARNQVLSAENVELNLRSSTGVKGNPDFLQLAKDTYDHMQRGDALSLEDIGHRAQLDLKFGDNLMGW